MDGPRRGTRSPIWDGREGDDGLWRFSDLTFCCKGAMDEQEARDRRSSAINKTVLFYGEHGGWTRGEAEEEGGGAAGAETRPPWGVRSRNRAPRRDRRGACGVLGCATSKEHVANVAPLFLPRWRLLITKKQG